MPTLVPTEKTIEVMEILQGELAEEEVENVHVEPVTNGFIGESPFLSGFFNAPKPDIIIYKQRQRDIPDLEPLGEVSRWFPENYIELPLAAISVNSNQSRGDLLTLTHFKEDDHPPKTVYVEFLDGLGSMRPTGPLVDSEETVFEDIDEFRESKLLAGLVNYVKEGANRPVYSDEEVREHLSEFDESVFHFSEVLNAYQNKQLKLVVILLSVFFEGYIEDQTRKAMEELRERPEDHCGPFYESWNLQQNLDACRFLGVLKESDYALISDIKSARNDYAHDRNKYHAHEEVLTEDRIEEAIQYYEKIIGVEQTMIDDR